MDSNDFEILRFRGDIEHEDEKRRVMTRLAYRFTDSWLAALIGGVMILLSVQLVIIFGVALIGGLPRGAVNDARTLLLFVPMAMLPILPLLIFKWRYARWGLVFLAASGGLTWLFMMLQSWIVGQLG